MVHPSRCSQIVIVLGFGLSLFCTSARAQAVFSVPKNISNNNDYSFTPQVASDPSGNIYVVWEDDTTSNSNILFRRSPDGGLTFVPAINMPATNLSNDNKGYSYNPRIAIDAQGAINVVWIDDSPGNKDIFFSRSTDGGNTFSPPQNLSNDTADSVDPQLAVDPSGNISVVWRNRNITFGVFYTHWTNGGTGFSNPINLATNLNGSLSPQLALDGTGNVNVVWQDDFNGQSDVSFSGSIKGAFSTAKSLASNSFAPQLAVGADGSINVAWLSNSSGHLNVFVSRSIDNGTTFSSMKQLSDGLADSGNPQIGVDASGVLYVVWEEVIPPSSNRDIFLSRSKDGGVTFLGPTNLSNNPGNSTSPCLDLDSGGGVNVSWLDTTPGPTQVFFTQSADQGVTFSATKNLSNDPIGYSADALMAADAKGNLNVVWDDDASGYNQIFFSQLPSGKKPNQPPQANAGADQIVDCTGHNCGLIKLDGSKSFDPDGDTLTYVWNEFGNQVATGSVPQFTAPLGAHTYTLTVTDPGGLSSSAVTHVTVQDKTAPTLQVSLSPSVLRSRDGKLVKVTAAINASDTCDPNPAVKLVSITSSEPADHWRHGLSDIQAVGGGPVPFGTDVRSFLLRAEGPEKGQKQVYTVTYSATDASGNTTTVAMPIRVTNHKSWGGHDGASKDDDDRNRDDDRNHKDRGEHSRSGH